MKRKIIKLTGIFMVIILISATIVGCSTNNDGKKQLNGTKSESPGKVTDMGSDKKDLVEIVVEIYDRGNVPPEEGTPAENRWTRWINEQMNKLGIKVTFYPIPRAESVTKLNVLMASKEAPDMVWAGGNDFHRFAESGSLTELSQYVEQHGSNIEGFWAKTPGLRDVGLSSGKLYGIPGGPVTPYTTLTYIRKDWLDKLEMNIPTNIDELYEAMIAFKEKDPGRVGAGNVIPLTIAPGGVGAELNITAIMSAFGVLNDFKMIDGRLLPPFLQPGYRDYVIYMNKLYREGLIDQEFAVDSDGQRSRAQTFGGQAGVWCGNWTWVNANNGANRFNHDSVENIPEVLWWPMDNFRDKNNEIQKVINNRVGFINCVPSFSKRATEVVMYLDWMVREGGTTIFNGFENEHYILKDGKKIPKDDAYNAKTLYYLNWDYGVMKTDFYDGEYLKAISEIEKFGEASLEAFNIVTSDATEFVVFDQVREQDMKYSATLNKLRLQGICSAIAGDNPGKIYDDFVEEYMRSGGTEVIEEATRIYQEMNKK